MDDGACRGAHVETWFPEQPDFRAAKRVCRRCPVIAECLDYALAKPELFGVWGGTSPTERAAIKRSGITRTTSNTPSSRTRHGTG